MKNFSFFRYFCRFDEQQSGNLTARLTELMKKWNFCPFNPLFSDIERVREGIGDKLSLFIQMAATFAAGFAIGFWFEAKFLANFIFC